MRLAKPNGRAVEWIGTAIVVAAAFRYWLWYFYRSTNLLDEGSTAAQALRVANGELIYRDFFTVVTPGSYYTVAWLFGLFGESLMVLRWAALVTGVLLLVATFLAARRVMAWPFAAAAALMTTVWGWFLVTPNYYSLEAALFAMTALVCGLHGSPRWLLAAGACAGLSAMTKQNVGAYAAVAVLVSIWLSVIFDDRFDVKMRLQSTLRFAGGIALVVVPVLLYLIAAGAGPYLYESWVYYPLAKYPPRFALPYPAFEPVLAEHGVITLVDAMAALITARVPEPAIFDIWTKLVIYLPVVVYPVAVAAIATHAYRWRARGDAAAARDGRALLAITLMGALLMLQAWPRADVPHILFGLQPTYILFAFMLHGMWRGLSSIPGPRTLVSGAAVVVALLPIALMLWNGYRRTDWEYANYVAHLRTPRAGGVTAVPMDAHRIDMVTQYIVEHTAPDEPIFVVPWQAGLYFLADRPNPTRIDFMLFHDPEAYPCLLAQLEANRPKYVVYGYTWDVDGVRFSEYAAPVDRYIRSRYAIEHQIDGFEIWRRIDGVDGGSDAWPGACRPRQFRWGDLFGRASDSASIPASSVQ